MVDYDTSVGPYKIVFTVNDGAVSSDRLELLKSDSQGAFVRTTAIPSSCLPACLLACLPACLLARADAAGIEHHRQRRLVCHAVPQPL